MTWATVCSWTFVARQEVKRIMVSVPQMCEWRQLLRQRLQSTQSAVPFCQPWDGCRYHLRVGTHVLMGPQ